LPQMADQNRLDYPSARQDRTIDVLHGVEVPDPYRWLEDADSNETRAWVEAQNALTRSMLDGPERDALVAQLTALFDYPRSSVPVRRAAPGAPQEGARYFFLYNSGLQNQPTLEVETAQGERSTLIDPNIMAPDATVAITAMAPSDDGTLVGYALSKHGSDRQEIFVREVATGRDRPDHLRWAKFTSIAWLKDASGFFYTRFPEPGTVPPGDEHYFSRVYFHRLGDGQAADTLVCERPDDREVVLTPSVSDDGRWLVITAAQGASDKSEVDVAEVDRLFSHGAWIRLVAGFSAAWHFVDAVDDRLFFHTDDHAPMGRIVAFDLGGGQAPPPIEIVPETSDKLNAVLIANRQLIVSYLHHASDQLRRFALDGTPLGAIALPGLGSVTGLTGRVDDPELCFGFTSFVHPPACYRYDLAGDTLAPFASGLSTIDPARYETKQVWYESKDGTSISMFLVHRRDLAIDGRRPVRLYGYGGFNISLTPGFDPASFVWLDRGGVAAVANLRGGGEYGEAWHEAGMRERKQNVFDDFIAAAEWLIASGYTSPRHLAIEGGSNGGLLVAAVMVQRPDLFGAVVCRVPVVDMLRYHLFTVGRFWIPEYGSSDEAEEFAYLIRYSPYHNVRDGVAYPPTLVMTADTDDRVAPGMARKFAARLQAASAGSGPILLRVETKAGHGAGKPVTKLIEEAADIYGFLRKWVS
jgi:prolyl oligopeptidase